MAADDQPRPLVDLAASRREWARAAVRHIDQEMASPHLQNSPFLRHKLLELRAWYAEAADDAANCDLAQSAYVRHLPASLFDF